MTDVQDDGQRTIAIGQVTYLKFMTGTSSVGLMYTEVRSVEP